MWPFSKGESKGSSQRVGVLIVHGIGTYEVGYSEVFRQKIKALLKSKGLSEPHDVCFEEVFWASITKSMQAEYRMNNNIFVDGLKRRWLRKFVIESLSDAAAYQDLKIDAGPHATENTYDRIQEEMRISMSNLRARVDAESPLVVVAHSFGGWIAHCYISDVQRDRFKQRKETLSPFERFDTLGGIVTIGCNIPVFTFSLDPANVRPFAFPGPLVVKWEEDAERSHPTPKWLNFYSPWDVLGYPLQTINQSYFELVSDIEIKIGGKLTKGLWADLWTPHVAYWTHRKVLNETADLVLGLHNLSRSAKERPLKLSRGQIVENENAPPVGANQATG